MVTLPRIFSASIRSRMHRARPRRARSRRSCRRRRGTAAASPRRRGPPRRASGSASGRARRAASRCARRRSRRRRGCRPCRSAGRRGSTEPGSTPSAIAMSCTSCDARSSAGSTSQVFRILPRSGMIAWNSRSRACFAEPPAESPSTRNSSAQLGILVRAVRELARKRRPRDDPLAHDLLCLLEPLLRVLDRERRDLVAALRVLVQPEREMVLGHAADECRAFARREPFLRLPRELRFGNLHREDVAARAHTSSGASLTPRGKRLRNSQNSRIASQRPVRNPFTCVPPCGVGIRLT